MNQQIYTGCTITTRACLSQILCYKKYSVTKSIAPFKHMMRQVSIAVNTSRRDQKYTRL